MKIKYNDIFIFLVFLYLFTIPFDSYKVLPISFSSVFGVLLIASVLFQKKIPKVKDYLPLAIFTLLTIVCSLIGSAISSSINLNDIIKNSILLLIMSFTIPSMLAIVNGEMKNFTKILKIFKFSAVIAVSTGFVELIAFLFFKHLLFNSIHIQQFDFLSSPVLRMKGVYFDPNYFSVICFLGYVATDVIKSKSKYGKRIFKVFFFMGAIFSFSRMGIFSFFIYEIIKNYNLLSKRNKWIFIYILLLVLPPFEFYFKPIEHFLYTLIHSSAQSSENRMEHLIEGVRLFTSSPLIGYGVGYVPKGGYLHNTYLQTAVYSGISVFALLYFYVIGFRRLINNDNQLSKKILAAFVSMLFIQMLLSYLLIKYLWFFFYLVIQTPILAKNEKNYSSN